MANVFNEINEPVTRDAPAPGQPSDLQTASSATQAVVYCSRCGTANERGLNKCINARYRAILPGSAMQLRHGLRRYQDRGILPPEVQSQIEEFREQLIADNGGLEQMTAVRAGLIRLLVDAEVGRLLLISEVVKRGIDSKQGGYAYDRLLATMDKWQRIAGLIGLNRYTKQVVDPLEAVAQAVEDAKKR